MKIGDKVRAMDGPEEGIIIGIDGNTIEVETEDGFSIPFQKINLVVVAKEEGEYFHGKPSTTNTELEEITSVKVKTLDTIPQLHIAYVPFNDRYTINI